MQLPVLMYHHVGPRRPGTLPNLTIAPEQFTRQMDWLARHGYQSITPEDWLQWVRNGKRLPQKPVMITFDDGYADLAEHAFPVLEKHGFRSIVFLVTGCIGGTNRWDSQISTHSHRLLEAGQIREWMRRGVQFGSHSRSHADLTRADIDLESEVHGSYEDLRELLGEAPSAFCYPYGRSNEAVREHVSRHYAVAFTVKEGLNSLTTDVLGLRRTMIKAHESLSGFAQRTRLGKNQREYIYQKLAALFA
jgi:peptidoglycan/xylan/chitin deacetylase (PgdA/CDA1 family)